MKTKKVICIALLAAMLQFAFPVIAADNENSTNDSTNNSAQTVDTETATDMENATDNEIIIDTENATPMPVGITTPIESEVDSSITYTVSVTDTTATFTKYFATPEIIAIYNEYLAQYGADEGRTLFMEENTEIVCGEFDIMLTDSDGNIVPIAEVITHANVATIDRYVVNPYETYYLTVTNRSENYSAIRMFGSDVFIPESIRPDDTIAIGMVISDGEMQNTFTNSMIFPRKIRNFCPDASPLEYYSEISSVILGDAESWNIAMYDDSVPEEYQEVYDDVTQKFGKNNFLFKEFTMLDIFAVDENGEQHFFEAEEEDFIRMVYPLSAFNGRTPDKVYTYEENGELTPIGGTIEDGYFYYDIYDFSLKAYVVAYEEEDYSYEWLFMKRFLTGEEVSMDVEKRDLDANENIDVVDLCIKKYSDLHK